MFTPRTASQSSVVDVDAACEEVHCVVDEDVDVTVAVDDRVHRCECGVAVADIARCDLGADPLVAELVDDLTGLIHPDIEHNDVMSAMAEFTTGRRADTGCGTGDYCDGVHVDSNSVGGVSA